MSEHINSWRDSSVAFEQQLDRNLRELKDKFNSQLDRAI